MGRRFIPKSKKTEPTAHKAKENRRIPALNKAVIRRSGTPLHWRRLLGLVADDAFFQGEKVLPGCSP